MKKIADFVINEKVSNLINTCKFHFVKYCHKEINTERHKYQQYNCIHKYLCSKCINFSRITYKIKKSYVKSHVKCKYEFLYIYQ